MKQGVRSGCGLPRRRRIVVRLFVALLVALLGGGLFSAQSFAASVTSYRGLTPGISTLDDTLRLLGKPVSKIFSDDRIICKYRFVQVNIPKKSGKVQFILIYDPSFRDVNGFRLGSHYSEVLEKLKVDGMGNTVVDLDKSIGYVFTATGVLDQIIYGIVR
ncbi:MAG: hypothetical protein PHI97_04850 [Desulfobulbus sp.]|nr:hypothetical protein [Desulfobulbus sp.]